MFSRFLFGKNFFTATSKFQLKPIIDLSSKRLSSTTCGTSLHPYKPILPELPVPEKLKFPQFKSPFFNESRIEKKIYHALENTKLNKAKEVLEAYIEHLQIDISPEKGKKIVVIGGQHLLGTNQEMITLLHELLGIPYKQFFLVGKTYSTNKLVKENLKKLGVYIQENSQRPEDIGKFSECYAFDVIKLWERVIEFFKNIPEEKRKEYKLIMLDDGGFLFKHQVHSIKDLIPVSNMIGMEQTTSGIGYSNGFRFPIILAASSFAKNLLEPYAVGEKIIEEIEKGVEKLSDVPLKNQVVGLVGTGNIGKAVLKNLIAQGVKRICIFDTNKEQMLKSIEETTAYDQASSQIITVNTIAELLKFSQVVIGTTGKNVIDDQALEYLLHMPKEKKIILASGSSRDTEFISFLQAIRESNTELPTTYPEDRILSITNSEGGVVYGLNWCEPVNFGNQKHSVKPKLIAATRLLLSGSLLTALKFLEEQKQPLKSYSMMCDPYLQKLVIENFLPLLKETYPREYTHVRIPKIEEILENSGGINIDSLHQDNKLGRLFKIN